MFERSTLSLPEPQRILIVQTSPFPEEPFQEIIKKTAIDVVYTTTIADALELVLNTDFDAFVVDVSVADSNLLDDILLVQAHVDLPIIILTNAANDPVKLEILEGGADDFVVKPGLTSEIFYRIIRYAIARYRRKAEIKRLTLIDELTGLYNRRGFLTIGEQQLKLSRREGNGLTVAFADLDGLKYINDQLGHVQGDLALQDTAFILKSTFRESDLVARIGGDEFAVLWNGRRRVEATNLLSRLESNIEAHGISERRPYNICLSIGFSQYEKGFVERLIDMLTESDRRMYEAKRRRVTRFAPGPFESAG